jgi:hypothetical protein
MPRRPKRRQHTPRAAVRRRRAPWTRWPIDRILDVRMCDLGVSLEGTWVADCVERLYGELERRGIALRPHVWISHDWFSPDGVPGFAVPFYLAHPRLARLERSQMLEVEGGSLDECLRILRHECGHSIQHAYRLNRRRRWQELFGRSSEKYPSIYRPNPASRRYVQHLRLYYAQSHPDEDFAETFAVWLTPRALWRKRYAGWPALKKLEYVDALMAEIGAARPVVRNRAQVDPLRRLRTTLREHYEEKRRQYLPGSSSSDVYDGDLRRLFSDDPKDRGRERASSFVRRNRTAIRRMVSRWTGEYEFTLDQVLDEMIRRCRELRLRARGPERRLRTDFALLLAVKTMQVLYRRRNWIAL